MGECVCLWGREERYVHIIYIDTHDHVHVYYTYNIRTYTYMTLYMYITYLCGRPGVGQHLLDHLGRLLDRGLDAYFVVVVVCCACVVRGGVLCRSWGRMHTYICIYVYVYNTQITMYMFIYKSIRGRTRNVDLAGGVVLHRLVDADLSCHNCVHVYVCIYVKRMVDPDLSCYIYA